MNYFIIINNIILKLVVEFLQYSGLGIYNNSKVRFF